MLTRDDLEQIRWIMHEEVHESVQREFREVVREEVSLQLKPVNRKLTHLLKTLSICLKCN